MLIFFPKDPPLNSPGSLYLPLIIDNQNLIFTIVPPTKSILNMDFPNTKCTQYHTKNWTLKQIEALLLMDN